MHFDDPFQFDAFICLLLTLKTSASSVIVLHALSIRSRVESKMHLPFRLVFSSRRLSQQQRIECTLAPPKQKLD